MEADIVGEPTSDPVRKPGTSACRLLGEAVTYGLDGWEADL